MISFSFSIDFEVITIVWEVFWVNYDYVGYGHCAWRFFFSFEGVRVAVAVSLGHVVLDWKMLPIIISSYFLKRENKLDTCLFFLCNVSICLLSLVCWKTFCNEMSVVETAPPLMICGKLMVLYFLNAILWSDIDTSATLKGLLFYLYVFCVHINDISRMESRSKRLPKNFKK